MHYTIIDMEKDPRCGQFAYFRGMTFPFAGLTVEMDITSRCRRCPSAMKVP